MRIIVVGAGIGGATLALALERAGLDYVVLEQAPALTEVGAGIQLSPNGVRVLDWLGLADDLAEFCVEPGAHQFKEWDSGENVLSTPLMPMARDRFGAPYYHAHRADLIAALAGRLNPARLRLGAEVVAVGQDGAGVTADIGIRHPNTAANGRPWASHELVRHVGGTRRVLILDLAIEDIDGDGECEAGADGE